MLVFEKFREPISDLELSLSVDDILLIKISQELFTPFCDDPHDCRISEGEIAWCDFLVGKSFDVFRDFPADSVCGIWLDFLLVLELFFFSLFERLLDLVIIISILHFFIKGFHLEHIYPIFYFLENLLNIIEKMFRKSKLRLRPILKN